MTPLQLACTRTWAVRANASDDSQFMNVYNAETFLISGNQLSNFHTIQKKNSIALIPSLMAVPTLWRPFDNIDRTDGSFHVTKMPNVPVTVSLRHRC